MNKKEVTAQVPEKKDADGKVIQVAIPAVVVSVDYSETLEEAAQMYGAEAILSNAFANWKVTLQAAIRTGLKKGETQEQLQTRLGSAKMGIAVAGAKVDTEAAYKAKFMASDPESRKKMIADLRSMAAG